MLIYPMANNRFMAKFRGLTFFGRTRGQAMKNALLWISANMEAANGK